MRCCGDEVVRQRGLRIENARGSIRPRDRRMDHLKRDFAAQVGIERLVSDAHGAPAEFNWRAITALTSSYWSKRCGLAG